MRVGGEVLALATFVAGEERAAAPVEAAHEHRARRWAPVAAGGGEDHRARLVGRRRLPVLHPARNLREGVGIDVADVEARPLVLRSQRIKVGRHHRDGGRPQGWLIENARSMACSRASTPSTFSRYHAPRRVASISTQRIEEARDHDHRALRVELQQLLHRAEPVGALHHEVDHDDVGLVQAWPVGSSRWRCRPRPPLGSRRSRGDSGRWCGSARRRRRGVRRRSARGVSFPPPAQRTHATSRAHIGQTAFAAVRGRCAVGGQAGSGSACSGSGPAARRLVGVVRGGGGGEDVIGDQAARHPVALVGPHEHRGQEHQGTEQGDRHVHGDDEPEVAEEGERGGGDHARRRRWPSSPTR